MFTSEIVSFAGAGLVGSMTNTILVMGGIYLFFGRQYAAAKGMDCLLYTSIKISPLPAECIALAKKYRNIFFLEEGVKRGGIGEYFLSGLAQLRYRGNFEICGIEQPFIPPMTITAALKRCGLDAQSIADRILEL